MSLWPTAVSQEEIVKCLLEIAPAHRDKSRNSLSSLLYLADLWATLISVGSKPVCLEWETKYKNCGSSSVSSAFSEGDGCRYKSQGCVTHVGQSHVNYTA